MIRLFFFFSFFLFFFSPFWFCRIIRSTEEIRASTQEVNRKRKFGQMEAGEKLAELNQRWHELVQRNIEIIQACKTIQEQSKERQAQVFWEGEGIPMEED